MHSTSRSVIWYLARTPVETPSASPCSTHSWRCLSATSMRKSRDRETFTPLPRSSGETRMESVTKWRLPHISRSKGNDFSAEAVTVSR